MESKGSEERLDAQEVLRRQQQERAAQRRRKPGGIPPQFPKVLYEMISRAEERNYEQLISWNENGESFSIHNKKRFINEVLPLYFKHSRYASFQRQLNLYGFQRVDVKERETICYSHEQFSRNRPESLDWVVRLVFKSSEAVSSSSSGPREDSKSSGETLSTAYRHALKSRKRPINRQTPTVAQALEHVPSVASTPAATVSDLGTGVFSPPGTSAYGAQQFQSLGAAYSHHPSLAALGASRYQQLSYLSALVGVQTFLGGSSREQEHADRQQEDRKPAAVAAVNAPNPQDWEFDTALLEPRPLHPRIEEERARNLGAASSVSRNSEAMQHIHPNVQSGMPSQLAAPQLDRQHPLHASLGPHQPQGVEQPDGATQQPFPSSAQQPFPSSAQEEQVFSLNPPYPQPFPLEHPPGVSLASRESVGSMANFLSDVDLDTSSERSAAEDADGAVESHRDRRSGASGS